MTKPKFNATEPLYIQIAKWLEDNIISGQLKEDQQIPSTNELSASLRINPATILKGINLLSAKKIVYKKRGLGVFISDGAKWQLREERRSDFLKNHIRTMLAEAEQLGISKDEIIELINTSDHIRRLKER